MSISTSDVSAIDVATTYSCTGQVMMAHWQVNADVTIYAVFAEQLKDDTGKIHQNALYVNVKHKNAPLSEDIRELVDVVINPEDGSISIEVTMDFTYGTREQEQHTMNS